MLIDGAVSGDRNVIKRETEKIFEYKRLPTEMQRIWRVKTKLVPLITGTTGTA
jgi:hypothetical protein